nr:cilia- and flagella- associated protein 210 [Nerophis lumbriciformis]
MSSLVQHGRRRGSGKSVDTTFNTIQLPDLRQITVLTKADWLRIQDKINHVDKEKERMMEVARQKQALHLKSKEMAKLWPDTLARQRQKKLEAKKIRDQMDEEKRKQIDMEEAQYREEKRKDAIEKAKKQLYYETERVKGLHRGLLLTEVLKEREAQIELKQRKTSASKDLDKEYVQMLKAREDEALKKEQERAQQKKQQCKAFAEDLQKQIKENQLQKEQQRHETKREGEEIQRCQDLHQWEQKMEEEMQAKQKNHFMQAQLEHLTQRDISKAADAKKQEAEEVQRKLFLSAKEKMVKLRRDREKELLREVQYRREKIMDKLIRAQQEQEEKQQTVSKAVSELDAQRIQHQWEEEQKRAEMIKSIAAHREHVIQERERNEIMRKEKEREALQAKKEDDRIFCEEQQRKTQSIRQELQKLQDFNASQMVAKQARQHQIRQAENEFQAKNMALLVEEELGFQQYSRDVVQAAAAAERSVIPLYKAVKEGGAGGPSFTGAKPRYLVQDSSGAEMPNYVSNTTQDIKNIHEVVDIEKAKKRLGFIWS